MKIPICWHAMRDGRGRFDSTAMVNDMFDLYDVEHFPAWDRMPDVEGAVIVVHGGREITREDKLAMDIENLKWALIIYLGDEEASFQTEKISHPNAIYWVQEPLMGKHDFAHRYILDGYAHGMQDHIVKCDRDLDWFFGGQVQNERRRGCVDALRGLDWGGIVIETKGFYQGIAQSEYYRTVCRAKIIPCPSGPFSQDAARPWSALECGSVPILDDFSPVRKEPGFWKMVLGDHPFRVIEDWRTLRDEIENLKVDWPDRQYEAVAWWKGYRESFNSWLRIDLAKLGVK